jgi:outer membrane protein TolC
MRLSYIAAYLPPRTAWSCALALCCLLSPRFTAAYAQERVAPPSLIELSAEGAVELALSRGGDLYLQAYASAAARRDAENAWNAFLPSFSISAQARLSDALFLPQEAMPGGAGPLATTISANLQLSLGSATPFDLKKREDDLRLARLREDEARARLAAAAEKAYWSIVAMAMDVTNKERALGLAEDRLRAASRRYELGLGAELDLLRAQLSLETAQGALAQARADHEKRLSAFRRQLGLPSMAPLLLTGKLDERPVAIAFAETPGLDRRFDIARLRLGMEAAELQRLRSLATVKAPSLDISASWSYSMEELDPSTQRDSYALSAGLRFNIDSWIPGSSRDLSYRRLLDERAKLEMDLRGGLRQAEDEVAGLVADLRLALSSAVNAERQLLLSERIRGRTRELYERGSATLLELEDAEYALEGAQQNVLSRRYQVVALFIDLSLALNLPWRSLAVFE